MAKRNGQKITINGREVYCKKEIKIIDGIQHIECSYLKTFIPITEFYTKLDKNKKYYGVHQPSKPGQLKYAQEISNLKRNLKYKNNPEIRERNKKYREKIGNERRRLRRKERRATNFGRRGTKILVNGKEVHCQKEVRIIDGIEHIECSYLKTFLPITDFFIKLDRKRKYFCIHQPSKPGQIKYNHEKRGIKPAPVMEKIVDGKLYRRCGYLKEFLPIEEFQPCIKYGKQTYSGYSRMGLRKKYKKDPSKVREQNNKWNKENRHQKRISSLRRKRNYTNATPKWLSESQLNEMKQVFKERDRLTKETGIQHNVHHIYPLYGTDNLGNHISCGLNVPWNLTPIPDKINFMIGRKNPEYHNYL